MDISHHIRKPYAYLLLVVVVIITSMVSFAYKYKNQIAERLIQQVGERTGLVIAVRESSISIFRTFPNVRLELADLSVVKESNFDSLACLDRVSISFDLQELWQGIHNIRYIGIDGGYIHLLTRSDGTDNFSFSLRDENPADTSRWRFNLEEVRLNETNIQYKDHSEHNYYIGVARDLRCRISYEEKIANMEVDGNLLLDEVTADSIGYLRQKSVTLRSRLLYDSPVRSLVINNSRVVVESTDFEVDGRVDFTEDKLVDLKISSNETVLKNLAALAPASMNEELAKYSAKGQVFLNATIRGRLGRGVTPSIYMDFGCQNTSVNRIDKPFMLDSLNFLGMYTNGDGKTLEHAALRIDSMKVRVGKERVSGRFSLYNFKDPTVDAQLNGVVDLVVLDEFFGFGGLDVKNGLARFSLSAQGKWKDLVDRSWRTARREVLGTFQLEELHLQLGDTLQPLVIGEAVATLSPSDLQLEIVAGNIGNSELAGRLTLQNWSGWSVASEKPVIGRAELVSEKIYFEDFFPRRGMGLHLEKLEMDVRATLPLRYFEWAQLIEQSAFRTDFLHFRLPKSRQTVRGNGILAFEEGDLETATLALNTKGTGLTLQGSLKGLSRWYKKRNASCQVDLAANIRNLALQEHFEVEEKWPELRNLTIDMRISTPLQHFLSPDSALFQKVQSSTLAFSLTDNHTPLSRVAANLRFIGNGLEIKELNGRLGENDFELKGEIQRYANWFFDSAQVSPELTLFLKSERLDLKDLLASVDYYLPANSLAPDQPLTGFPLNCRYLDAEIKQLAYEKMHLEQVKAKGSLWEMSNLRIDTAMADFAGGNLGLKGEFSLKDSVFRFASTSHQIQIAEIFDMFGKANADIFPAEQATGITDAETHYDLRFKEKWKVDWGRSRVAATFQLSGGTVQGLLPLSQLAALTQTPGLLEAPFQQLSGQMLIDSGEVVFPAFNLVSPDGRLFLVGHQHPRDSFNYRLEIPLGMMNALPASVLETMPGSMAQFLTREGVLSEPKKPATPEAIPLQHHSYKTVDLYLHLWGGKHFAQLVYDRQEAAGKIRLMPYKYPDFFPTFSKQDVEGKATIQLTKKVSNDGWDEGI